MKINLIKVDSVHSKENSGISPRVSLPSQLCGYRAWGLEPGGPKLEFWLCHSAMSLTVGDVCQRGKSVTCLIELPQGYEKKNVRAAKSLDSIKHSASWPFMPPRLETYLLTQPRPAEAPQEEL